MTYKIKNLCHYCDTPTDNSFMVGKRYEMFVCPYCEEVHERTEHLSSWGSELSEEVKNEVEGINNDTRN